MTQPDFRALCAELVEAFIDESTYAQGIDALDRARAALATPPPEPPKNCWLDDEPDMFPSPCVFDDPSEVISDCKYARTVKCKTDCKYYRVAAHFEPVQAPPPEPVAYIHRQGNYWEPSERMLQDDEKERGWTEEPLYAATPLPPEPPTDREIYEWVDPRRFAGEESAVIIRAALERWGNA